MGEFVGRLTTDVNATVDDSYQYADDAFTQAIAFLDALKNYAPQITTLAEQVEFDEITTPSSTFQKPTLPDAPIANVLIPNLPEFPDIDSIDADDKFNSLVNPGAFTGTSPNINIDAIPKPGDLTASQPGSAPETNFDIEGPATAPSTTLPNLPDVLDLDLPTAPDISQYSFDLTLPDDSAITVPGITFNFTEIPYSSELLDAVYYELKDRVENGGTGLPVVIENAIWERAKNREDQENARTVEEIVSKNATRGFQRPPGSVTAAIDAANQASQSKIADLSREIAIKQAELEQSNIKHAIEQSIQLENILINQHNNVMNRALEVQKIIQQVGIQIYEAEIQQFNVQLAAYKTAGDVFETRVRAELTKAEVFKVQIEGEKLKVDINDSNTRLYLAQIEGIKQAIEVYKAQWDAVNIRVNAEAQKLLGFKSEVEAFAALVSAKATEWDAYATRIKGEATKADVFDSQVKAYSSQIQAYAAQVDAVAKEVDAEVEENKIVLQEHLARIDQIVKVQQMQNLAFTAEVDKFKALASAYTAEVTAEEARVRAESSLFDLEIQEARAKADIELKNAEINLANARNATELLLEAMKSGAQTSSNLVAASLSALNISMGIQRSNSLNESHNYQEK